MRNVARGLIAATIIAIALTGCSGKIGGPPTAEPAATTAAQATDLVTPNFVGLAGDKAKKTAEALGLEITWDAGDQTVIRPSNWTVTAQTPAFGEKVPAGTTVTLTVTKPEEITPTPVPPPAPAPALAQQVFTGTSDNVVDVNLAGGPAIITFDCPDCDGNTVLQTNGFESLLVNEIGPWHGQYLVDARSGSATSVLTISATGNWTVVIDDIATVPLTSGPAVGSGDTVVHFSDSFTRAAITNDGASNFVVQGYGGGYVDLAVNTIGGYSGTVPLKGPGYVQVTSSGNWTITPG